MDNLDIRMTLPYQRKQPPLKKDQAKRLSGYGFEELMNSDFQRPAPIVEGLVLRATVRSRGPLERGRRCCTPTLICLPEAGPGMPSTGPALTGTGEGSAESAHRAIPGQHKCRQARHPARRHGQDTHVGETTVPAGDFQCVLTLYCLLPTRRPTIRTPCRQVNHLQNRAINRQQSFPIVGERPRVGRRQEADAAQQHSRGGQL
jgi:hypothetical protein